MGLKAALTRIAIASLSVTLAMAMMVSTASAAPATQSAASTTSVPSNMPNPRHMWASGNDIPSGSGNRLASGNGTASKSPDESETDETPRTRDARYTPYWQNSTGTRAFYDGFGELYMSRAVKVIDVSEWNGTIDWSNIKNGDVNAVVLRAGYGDGGEDRMFAANLAAVRKYRIPFSVYWYSYAYDASFAQAEARSLASLLAKYGVTENELAMPVFYDLEAWTWTGFTEKRPSDPQSYEIIVNKFNSTMSERGYGSTAIYSYTNYLNTALASPNLWAKTAWVAQYGPQLTFTGTAAGQPSDSKDSTDSTDTTDSADDKKFNWQYTSSGTVDGITGNTDLSAFDAKTVLLGGFRDVTAATSHAWDIDWLSSKDITTGWKEADGSVTFRGMSNILRQDMAAFLYRMAGSPSFDVSKANNPFSDVTPRTPHYKEILWLASTGITTGWKEADGTVTFRGGKTVKRQDMAAFLNRFASFMGDKTAATWQPNDVTAFDDVTDKTPHQREVFWLTAQGIAQGWTEANGDVVYRGMNDVVRQDMAAFLHRLSDYLAK